MPMRRQTTGNVGALMEYLDKSRDAFERDVRLGTTNEADLAAHYPYSPERYRVLIDGVREQIQYDGFPAQFTDNVDSFSLLPQSDGEVVTFETNERYRYVVQYVLEWSAAFQINQDLQAGDAWAVGYGIPDFENSGDDTPGPSADGWFIYQNSSMPTQEAELVEYRNGTEVDSATLEFQELPQTWGRIAGETNWYNVGETTVTETYTTANPYEKQQNIVKGRVSADDGKGPETGNHALRASVKAGDGAGSLELEVGSFGLRTLGNVQGLLRVKTFDFIGSYDGPTGEFEPLIALRTDPNRNIINTQLAVLEPLEFSGSDDIVLIAQVFDKRNVLDSGGNQLTGSDWQTPPELNATNSIVEESFNVAQFPDANGNIVTSAINPGGYQVGYGSLTNTGSGGAGSARVSSRGRTQKRQLPSDDIVVILARSPSTGDVTCDVQFEQDW